MTFDTVVLVQLLILAGGKSSKETVGSSPHRAGFEFILYMEVHSTGPHVWKKHSVVCT